MNIKQLYHLPLYWEMTNSEKIALLSLLSSIKPTIAIEIGTKEGGSLQLISHFSEKVYSLDIDPSVVKLKSNFKNVTFITGDSAETLPALLSQLALNDEYPDFIFIDGDHSAEGVYRDITNSLQTTITKPLHILMHDSFNPECRRGMLQVDYSYHKNVQLVDIDFIQGIYSPSTLTRSEMWGGFGLIQLDIDKSIDKPIVKQSSQYSFNRMFAL